MCRNVGRVSAYDQTPKPASSGLFHARSRAAPRYRSPNRRYLLSRLAPAHRDWARSAWASLNPTRTRRSMMRSTRSPRATPEGQASHACPPLVPGTSSLECSRRRKGAQDITGVAFTRKGARTQWQRCGSPSESCERLTARKATARYVEMALGPFTPQRLPASWSAHASRGLC